VVQSWKEAEWPHHFLVNEPVLKTGLKSHSTDKFGWHHYIISFDAVHISASVSNYTKKVKERIVKLIRKEIIQGRSYTGRYLIPTS